MAVRMFRNHLIALLTLISLTFAAHIARADKEIDARRTLMTGVKRIVVVPPFFGTDTIQKIETKDASLRPKTDQDRADLDLYLSQLRKLQARVKTRLPERVAARTPFQVVPYAELEAALEDLLLTPEQLFQNSGRMKGNRFATPNPEAIRKLCAALKADAVLLGVLDEPRRNNGRYIFDPCGIYYESAHVRSRAGYFVVLADGTEAIKPVLDVLRPLTRIGKRDYVLVDWLEAQDVLMENLMDEWTRYTPEKK